MGYVAGTAHGPAQVADDDPGESGPAPPNEQCSEQASRASVGGHTLRSCLRRMCSGR